MKVVCFGQKHIRLRTRTAQQDIQAHDGLLQNDNHNFREEWCDSSTYFAKMSRDSSTSISYPFRHSHRSVKEFVATVLTKWKSWISPGKTRSCKVLKLIVRGHQEEYDFVDCYELFLLSQKQQDPFAYAVFGFETRLFWLWLLRRCVSDELCDWIIRATAVFSWKTFTVLVW